VRRKRLLGTLGLGAVAAVAAIAVVVVATHDGADSGDSPVRPALAEGIEARASIVPRTILFGDTIAAHVDLVLDRRRVDPDSVRIATEFLPWEMIGEPKRLRRDAGAMTHLETTFLLRCTSSPCLPANQSAALEFDRARLSFTQPGAALTERKSVGVKWPLLLVYSRFAAANLEGASGRTNPNPWRIDLISLPAVSYRVSPGPLVVAFLVVAGALALAGSLLVYFAVPRRGPAPPPEPEPEPEPEITLTPLEQALVLLEDADRADGVEDRRRALELVAEVLIDANPELARAARALAWSEDAPVVEDTSGLASRVRTVIDLNGNGRAE
jgi:hypothetical protein